MKNFSAPKNLMNKRNYSEIELIKDKMVKVKKRLNTTVFY